MAGPDRRTTRRWPTPDGPWRLTFHWVEIGGRSECVGLDIGRVRSSGRILLTTTVLRDVHLATLIDEERSKLLKRRIRPKRPIQKSGPRLGRPPKGFDHYLEVARVYGNAWQEGTPPTRAVAERWGVKPSTAAKWVQRARELNILGPTPKGKAGGVDRQFIVTELGQGREASGVTRSRDRRKK